MFLNTQNVHNYRLLASCQTHNLEEQISQVCRSLSFFPNVDPILILRRQKPQEQLLINSGMLSMEPWAAAKKLLSSVAVPPAPVRVPSQSPLSPSVTSVANDKGDNEIIPGAVHRSPYS